MPWSSGTFSRTNGTNSGSTTWTQDKAGGTKIVADRHDTHDQDLATGINNCLTKDGQNTATANLPMGGNKHTDIADGTSRTQYASIGQIQDGEIWYAASAAGSDSYAITLSPAVTAYQAGQVFHFKADVANTGSATLNVNGLGAKDIRRNGNLSSLQTGQIKANQIVTVVYDGTQFQMQSQDAQIQTSTIATSAVTANELASNAVTTAKITDSNVTTAKIADNAVTLAKQASGTADRLQGFDGSGDPAEVTVGTGLALSSGTLSSSVSGFAEVSSELNLGNWTVGGQVFSAHGMASTPDFVLFCLECTTAEFGYAVGDRINPLDNQTLTAGAVRSFGLRWNGTNIVFYVDTAVEAPNATTPSASTVQLTSTSWDVIVRGVRF